LEKGNNPEIPSDEGKIRRLLEVINSLDETELLQSSMLFISFNSIKVIKNSILKIFSFIKNNLFKIFSIGFVLSSSLIKIEEELPPFGPTSLKYDNLAQIIK